MWPIRSGGAGLALASFAALVVFLALVAFDLRAPRSVHVDPLPPAHAPLTAHLAIVVLDGVRYDLAADPARAPNLARHLRDDAHAEVWAGAVTMTSAAVLTLGSGARGDYAQIMFNLSAAHAEGNDLFANAHAAGMTTALAGDGTWADVFGEPDRAAKSASGVSWEVDDSERVLADGLAFATGVPSPNVLVVHVLAPDHQGHAYGVASEKYRAHLRALDARVEAFLTGLPAPFTVAVMSDHGAEDDGSHGVDTDLERRCPFFAYGPGVRRGVDLGRVDQVDLASTFAALLGISSPAHGRGIARVELLDVDDDAAAAIACTDAARVRRLAEASGARAFLDATRATFDACSGGDPRARIDAAHAVVRRWDAEVRRRDEALGLVDAAGVAAALAAFLVVACAFTFGLGALPRAALACAIAGMSVALTWLVDHGDLPFATRAIVVGASLVPLVVLVAPTIAARIPPASYAFTPGLFFVSFPRDTKWFALVLVGSCLALLAARAHREKSLDRGHLALAAIGAAALGWTARGGVVTADFPFPRLELPACALVLALFAFVHARDDRPIERAAAFVLPAASLFLRDRVPSSVGLALVVVSGLASVAAARALRRALVAAFALSGYALLSRNAELLSVLAALLVASSAARTKRSESFRTSGPADPILLVALLFAALFLARVGVQRGLEFTTIDLHAGVFDDPHASFARTMACVCAKYVLVAFAVLAVAVPSFSTSMRASLVGAVTVAFVARTGVMALTLFACRGSFWSSQRALSELPCAILVALAAILVSLVGGRRRPSDARG